MNNLFDVKCRCGKNLKSLLEITEDFDDDGEWSLYPKLSVFLEMSDDWYSQYTDEFYDLSLQ